MESPGTRLFYLTSRLGCGAIISLFVLGLSRYLYLSTPAILSYTFSVFACLDSSGNAFYGLLVKTTVLLRCTFKRLFDLDLALGGAKLQKEKRQEQFKVCFMSNS